MFSFIQAFTGADIVLGGAREALQEAAHEGIELDAFESVNLDDDEVIYQNEHIYDVPA